MKGNLTMNAKNGKVHSPNSYSILGIELYQLVYGDVCDTIYVIIFCIIISR